MSTNNDNMNLKHGAVILLDVLGTKNKLERLPEYIVEIESLYDRLDLIKRDPRGKLNEYYSLFQGFDPEVIFEQLQNLTDGIKKTDNFEPGKRCIPDNYTIETKIETFSDTILIAIYTNYSERRDDLITTFAGHSLSNLLKYMFSHHNVKLRGAIGIGNFCLIEKNKNSILMGAPMFEVADLFEESNWIGVMTTPSATLAIDQMNSFSKYIDMFNLPKLDATAKQILDDFFRIIKIIDVGNTCFIKYNVPLKKLFANDCYALAWPLTHDKDVEEIEKNY
jgi:hypothetical protein